MDFLKKLEIFLVKNQHSIFVRKLQKKTIMLTQFLVYKN